MKKQILLILIFLLPVTGFSQFQKDKLSLNIQTGAVLPLAPDHLYDYWNKGYNFDLNFGYQINPLLSVYWSNSFSTLIFDHQTWQDDFTDFMIQAGVPEDDLDFVVSGANRYFLASMMGVKLSPLPANRFAPYLSGGLGFFQMHTDDLVIGLPIVEYTVETVPCFQIGGGVTLYKSGNFAVLLQGSYDYALTRDQNRQKLPMSLFDSYQEYKTSFFRLGLGVELNLK